MFSLNFRNHTVSDFIGGNLMIAFPFLLQIDRALGETWIPVLGGLALLLNNFFTDHDLGIFRRISCRKHFFFDVAIGVIIMLSPWIAGFWHYVFLPHLILGGAWTAYSLRNLRSCVSGGVQSSRDLT